MINATAATFDELVAEGVVLLDFHAPWCGPCRALGPILEQVEGAKVVKVNVDEEQDLAKKFNISAIPKLVILKDGVAVSEMIGLQPQQTIKQKVDEAKIT